MLMQACLTLAPGAPTGVGQGIPASGIWPAKCSTDAFEDFEPMLNLCDCNHVSADLAPDRVQALLNKEIEQGYVQHIPGGRAAVLAKFPPERLAIGKLGIVKKEGKKDRLIGDSRASGASPSANFADRAEVPSLLHCEAALFRFASFSGHGAPLSTEWVMLALDVQGTHKSIRTAPADVGLAVFHLLDEYYVYVVNHFGAAGSAM